MSILDLGLSAISAGATGLLGVVFQRAGDIINKYQDRLAQKDKFEQAVALKRVDAEIMAQEWNKRVEVAKVEGETASDVEAGKAFAVSLTSEPKLYSEGVKKGKIASGLLVLLDFVRGLIRPALTIYLIVLTTMIYRQAVALLGDGAVLTDAKALALLDQIINTILYLTTTCVLWWFGTRNKGKAPS